MGSGKSFSKIGKLIKKVDPLRGGDVILEGAGLPTLTGEGDKNILDFGSTAAEKAAKDQMAQAAAQADAERAAAQQQAEAIRAQTAAAQQSANTQMQFAMQQQNSQAAEAARQAALSAGRDQASATAAEAAADSSTPSVTTADGSDSASVRRKYNAKPNVTKTSSIRL